MTSGSSREYIELLDSSGSGAKYRVAFGGYKPLKEKTGKTNRTAGGGIDRSVGDVYQVHQYSIWLYSYMGLIRVVNIKQIVFLYFKDYYYMCNFVNYHNY